MWIRLFSLDYLAKVSFNFLELLFMMILCVLWLSRAGWMSYGITRPISICKERLNKVKTGLLRREIKWNGPFYRKVFEKEEYLRRYASFLVFTGIIEISRCYAEARDLFPKIATGKDRFIWFPRESARELYCSFWRKILTGFSIQMESPQP